MKFKRMPLLAYFCLLPLLVYLGVWQLNRAEEKRDGLNLQKQGQNSGVVSLSGRMEDGYDAMRYRKIKAIGYYDNQHQFLLDNQVYQGRAGYFVLTPFLLDGESTAVLVNRGWIPIGKSRNELPSISISQKKITLSGRINRFPRVGLKLEGAEIPTLTWPAVIQVVDTLVIAGQIGYSLLPVQVELDQDAEFGFVRAWHESVVMTPEKHTAYAVQWFLLAITLTLLWAKYGRENGK